MDTNGYLKRHKKIRKVLESQKRRNKVLEGKKAEEHNAPENQKEIASLVDRLLATKSTTEANRLRNRLLYIHHRDARKRYYAKRKRRFAEDPQLVDADRTMHPGKPKSVYWPLSLEPRACTAKIWRGRFKKRCCNVISLARPSKGEPLLHWVTFKLSNLTCWLSWIGTFMS